MKLIDLSRELFHKEPSNPGAVPPQVWVWRTHEETKHLHETGHSSTNRMLIFGDHSSTHVDAPLHFDASEDALDVASVPLERFYGPAICIDVSETSEPGWIDVYDLKEGLKKNGLSIQKGDIVLLYSGHYQRTYPNPEYFSDYPGMTPEAANWLHQQGVENFGVEGPNPGHPSDKNFEVHVVCCDTGMIHMEGLANLESVVGKRFVFAGFPLKIKNGSGSPIRAVAILDE